MGFAEFLKKRFMGKEVCMYINNGDEETITLEQVWSCNRDYFQGLIKDIDEGIIILEVDGGEVYINPDDISYVWEKPLNIKKIIKYFMLKN